MGTNITPMKVHFIFTFLLLNASWINCKVTTVHLSKPLAAVALHQGRHT